MKGRNLKIALAFSVVAAGSMAGVPRQAQAAVPSTPRIRCQIEMDNWCIAFIGGKIDMATVPQQGRVWTLQTLEMSEGPLRIIESDRCNGEFPTAPRLKVRKEIELSGVPHISVEYQIDTGKWECTLEFQWPATGASGPAYERTMKHGIFLRDGDRKKQVGEFVK